MPFKKSFPAAPAQQTSTEKVSFAEVEKQNGNRTVIYGTGGIGKTSVTFKLPGKTAFFDRDGSLGKLNTPKNVVVVPSISSWADVRKALNRGGWESISNIVLDSGSELEKDCIAHVVATIPTEKGQKATSILSYGFGKGYTHLYEQFIMLLADLDKHFRAGRNVVIICHEDRANVPNPEGEDWIRYEPLLYQSDKASLRAKVKNWADHVLFYGYEVVVEDGVGKGSGTRTIWTNERPHCMAKSRICSEVIPIPDTDFNPWPIIFGQAQAGL